MGRVSSFFTGLLGKKKKKDQGAFAGGNAGSVNPLYQAGDKSAAEPQVNPLYQLPIIPMMPMMPHQEEKFDNDEFMMDVEFDNAELSDEFASPEVAPASEPAVADTTAADTQVEETTEEVLDAAPAAATRASALEELEAQLQGSNSHGHANLTRFFSGKNSDDYEAVLSALHNAIQSTKGSFSKDTEANGKMIRAASMAAAQLASACQNYLAKKSGAHSSKGKDRLSKVGQILELAMKDKANLWTFFDSMHNMTADQQASLSWDKILHDARSEVIEVDDLSKVKSFGGSAKVGEDRSRGLDEGMFTADVFGRSADGGDNKLQTWAEVTDSRDLRKDQLLSRDRNISARNVATTRVAGLIGMGDLVAGSKSVKVHDKATDRTISGNLMEWAKGSEASGEFGSVSKDVVDAVGDDVDKREELIKAKMTPTLMGQLMNLQILDYLCQQNDRHAGNYFVTKDENGAFSGLTAIDNDMSFGLSTDYQADVKAGEQSGEKQKAVVDSEGHLVVPYMEKATAMRILDLTPEELEYALADLIEDDTVDAAKTRLTILQNAIKTTMKEEPERFVEQWSMDMHEKLMSQAMLHKHLKSQAKSGTDDMLTSGFKDLFVEYGPKKDFGKKFEMSKGNTYYSSAIYAMMGVSSEASGNAHFNSKKAIYRNMGAQLT